MKLCSACQTSHAADRGDRVTNTGTAATVTMLTAADGALHIRAIPLRRNAILRVLMLACTFNADT